MRNQKPKFFFYVEAGRVQLVSKLDKVIATFTPGDSFGEMALFTDRVRSATAKSIGDTTLHVVGVDFIKDYFEKEDILVKFSDVSKQYGDIVVLDKLNLEIKKNEMV